MQETNHTMISRHSTSLRSDSTFSAEFLLQFARELAASADLAEELTARTLDLIQSFFAPSIALIAYPSEENQARPVLRWRSTGGDQELPNLIRNLLLTGFDAVYPQTIESLPAYAGHPKVFVKSPAASTTRVLILAIFDNESSAEMMQELLPAIEHFLCLGLEVRFQRKKNTEYESDLEELHRTSASMIAQMPLDRLLESVIQDACKVLFADAAAVLLPADETKNSYREFLQFGFSSAEMPLSNALFSKAFVDFAGQPNKGVIYHGRENEKFLLVPLLSRGEPYGILFFYGKTSAFRLSDNRIKLAEIFGHRVALAMANARNFQKAFDIQAQWENTFDSISDPIYIIDNEYLLKKINKSMASIANRELDLPVDRNCYSYLFQRDSICPWCPVPAQQESGEAETVETRLFGAGLWQIQTFPYRNKAGERTGSIQVLRDVTLLKKMQEQLIETEKLASMGKLISGVAHEVRNPLFGISATARALKNELEGKEEIKPFLDIITSETTRLNRLMEELLNYSRPVRIDKNPSDLAEIVHEVVDYFKQLPNSQHAVINFPGSDRVPAINLDRNKIKQALINLVENAIQHSGETPRIDIFLEFLSLVDPPQISLVVKDNGSGISPENLQKIFDPFYTTRQRGTGLGLSIVRKVVHDHGGRIAVESHLAHGTTFRLSLPVGTGQA